MANSVNENEVIATHILESLKELNNETMIAVQRISERYLGHLSNEDRIDIYKKLRRIRKMEKIKGIESNSYLHLIDLELAVFSFKEKKEPVSSANATSQNINHQI